MSFDEYKKIHVLFSHENPKSQLSLEIKTNPRNEIDVKVRLKFLYEFGLKEFNNNSVMLAFEIDCDSLTNEIKNDFKYILPDLISIENNLSDMSLISVQIKVSLFLLIYWRPKSPYPTRAFLNLSMILSPRI